MSVDSSSGTGTRYVRAAPLDHPAGQLAASRERLAALEDGQVAFGVLAGRHHFVLSTISRHSLTEGLAFGGQPVLDERRRLGCQPLVGEVVHHAPDKGHRLMAQRQRLVQRRAGVPVDEALPVSVTSGPTAARAGATGCCPRGTQRPSRVSPANASMPQGLQWGTTPLPYSNARQPARDRAGARGPPWRPDSRSFMSHASRNPPPWWAGTWGGRFASTSLGIDLRRATSTPLMTRLWISPSTRRR